MNRPNAFSLLEAICSVTIVTMVLAACIPLLFRLSSRPESLRQPTAMQLLLGIAQRDLDLATHASVVSPRHIELLTTNHVSPCDNLGPCVVAYQINDEQALTRTETPIAETTPNDGVPATHSNDSTSILALTLAEPSTVTILGLLPNENQDEVSIWDPLSPERAIRLMPTANDDGIDFPGEPSP